MKKILSIIIIIVLSTILGLAYNFSTNLSLRLLEATDDVRPLREDLNYNFELVDDIFNDVSFIEFSYLDGVTSAIQTQLNAKQPLDAQLTDIAGLTPTDSYFIVGDGTNFITESGDTARTSLGIDLSLYYLKTAIDSLSEVESIYSKDITDSTELASALTDYYLKTAIDTQGEMESIWSVKLVTDATTCTDLEGTLLSIATGTLNAAIPEDHINATMLKDDNAPADGDIYCYESTGTTGHWYTPGELITAGTAIAWTGTTLNVTLRTEAEVKDWAGGMFTGNTETLITATYQVGDDTLDLVVDSAAVTDDDTTHVPTCDGVFEFCETTQDYMQDLVDDTTPELGGTLDHNNERDTEVKTVEFNGLYANGNSGATPTVDWQNGNYQSITISENALLTFSNVFVGTITLVMTYTTGDYTLGFDAAHTIHEEGGTEISFTETDGAIDILKVMYLGSANNFVVGALLDVKD